MNRRFIVFFTLFIVFTLISPVLAATAPTGTLQFGSRGQWVIELQQMLKKNGFFPAAQQVTGYFGGITSKAVTEFERKYGLQVDGKVNPSEWKVLAAAKPSKVVLGYYAVDYPGDKLSYNSLLNAPQGLLNQVAMFDFYTDGAGNLKGTVSTDSQQLAGKKGTTALMVVHNINNGSCDKQAAINVVSGKASRSNLVKNIISQIDNYGYDGVNIDLEGLSADRKNYLIYFLEELRTALTSRGKLLTIAVPAKTDDQGNAWSGAYDYKRIGPLADYVVLMTYDEHWLGGSPGPVASQPWVTRVVNYAVTTMPSQKILMGVGSYGYDWPAWGNGKTVKWKDVSALAAAYGPVQWSNAYSVPYFNYIKNGVSHQVWFENSYSLAIKLHLIENKQLGGIALWRLGFEDYTLWSEINKAKNSGNW